MAVASVIPGRYSRAMHDSRGRSSDPLIAPLTTETFTVLPGRVDAGLIILCDHASNAFPPGYGTLGMPPEQLRRHIAYDIGAAEVTRTLAAALGAPAIMTHYSRLLIDPNRGTDDPTLIMRLSDGAVVPGNRSIDASERERRIRLYHAPYHEAVDHLIDACAASGTPPALLAIHSFTESWRGLPRPWHVGILWDADDRLAAPLLEALYAENDLIVGDNEPYSGRLQGDTLWRHGTGRGLVHALVEIRQDLIREERGQHAWAERLGRLMRDLAGRPHLPFRLWPAHTEFTLKLVSDAPQTARTGTRRTWSTRE
jgi:predicted N-formylglutamate amidohydrolase